ncbi:MAG: YggS family pyridoxal phosphate-dependent enzyme [Actinomycetota bacterium]|nr:YggS family pyridoxal phosphate-dependent enzyme [Actinomycetota bacterium]
MSRREELAAALTGLRQRIRDACAAAERPESEVRLLAVTKTFPAADVGLLVDLGLAEFGESRDQEAAPKTAELAELRPAARVRWEMVGRLQRNKARSVARWADVVQSVDSPRLVDALARAGCERRAPLRVLVQASLDGDPGRGGCPPAELDALAERVAAANGLVLAGVMGIAPLPGEPESAFEALALMAERLRRDHPDAVELSAGMSGDLEIAVAHGSTCVRVGTALLGGRPLASS